MKRFIINGSGSSENESTDEELEEEVIEEVEEEDEGGGGGGGGEVGREEEYEEEDSAENTSDEGRFVVMFDQATSPTPPSEISEPESMESTQEPAEDNTQPAAQVGGEARGGPRRGRTTAQISLDGINFGLHHLTPRAACEPSTAPGAAPSLRTLLPAALALAVMLALQPLLHLPELNQLLHDAAAPHPHPFGAPPGTHPMDFLDSHLKIDINTGAGHSEVLQGNIRRRTYDLNARVTHEIPMPNIVTNDTQNTQATEPTPGPSSAPTMYPRSGGTTNQEEQYSQRPPFTGGQDQNALATIMGYLRSIFGTYLLNFANDYHQIVSHLQAAFSSPQNRPSENTANATPSTSGTFVPRVHHPESPSRAKRKATSTAEHASGMPKRISLHQPHPSVPENASQSVTDPARPSTSTGLSGSTSQRKLPTRPKLKGILKSVRYEDSGKSTHKSRNKQLCMSQTHARARASHSHERDTGQRSHSDAGISDPPQRSLPHPSGQRSGYDSRMSQGARSMHQTHPGTHVPTCRPTSAPSTSTHSDPGTSRSQRESQEGPENVFTRAGPQFSSRPQDRERQESTRNLQQLAETEDEDWEEDSEDGSTGTNDSINANILYSSFVGSLREPQENFHGPQDLRTVRRDERVQGRPTVIFSSQITSGHHSRSSEGQESAGGGHRRSQLQTSDPHSSAHSLSTGQQRPPPTPHSSAPQQPPRQQHPPPTSHALAPPPQTPRQHQPPPTHSLAHPPSSVWQQTSHPTPHSSAGPQLPRHQQPHPTAQLQQIWIQKPFPIPHSSPHVQPTWIQGVPHPQYTRYLHQPTGDYHRTDMGGISVPHQHYTGFNTHVSANGTYLQTGQPEIVATHGVEHIIREQIVNGTLETIKEYSERMHNGTLSLYEAAVAMSSMQVSANSQPSYGHGSQPSTSTTTALNTTYETAEYTENTMSQDTTSTTSEHRRLSPNESATTPQSTIESSYEHPEQTSRSTGTAQQSTIPPVHKLVDHSTSGTSSTSQNHNQLPNAHAGQTAGSRVNLAESSAHSSDWRPIQEPVAPVYTHTCNVPSVHGHSTHISNESSQSTMALVLSHAVQPVNDSSSSLNSTAEPANGQSIHSPNKSATARQSIMVLVPVPINNLLGDSASALSYSVPSTYGPLRPTLGITSTAPQSTTALPVPIDNAVRNIPFVLHSDKPSTHGPLNPTSSGTDAVSQSAMDLIRILTDETTTSASAVDSNVPTVLDDSSETSNKTDSGSQSEMESVHVPIDRPMSKIGSAPHSNAKSANRRVDQTSSSTDNESQSDMTLIPADGISSSAVHCTVLSANGRSGQMRSKTDNTSQSLLALPPPSTNHRAKFPTSALKSVENSAHGQLNPTPSLTAAVSEPTTSLSEEPLELSKGKVTSVDQSTKLSSPEHTATTSQPMSSSVCPRQDPPSPATMTDPVTPRHSPTRTASKVALDHHEQEHAPRNPQSMEPVDETYSGNDDSMISTEQIARILCEVRAASGARARSRDRNEYPTGMFEQRTDVRLNDQVLGKIDAGGTESVKLQTESPGSDGDASVSAHPLDECEKRCGQTGEDQKEKQAGFGGRETDGDGSEGALHLAVPAARRRAASPSPYQPPLQRARLDDRPVTASSASALDAAPQSMQRKTDADPPQCLSKPLAMWQTLDTQSQEQAQPEEEPLNLEVAAQATARGSAPTPSPARVSAGRPSRVQDSGRVTSPEADHAQAPSHLGHACAPDEPHAQESAPGGQAQAHAQDPGRRSVESSQEHAPGHMSDTGSSQEEVPLTQSHGHVRISSASRAQNDVHASTPSRSEVDHDNPTRSVDAQVSDQESHLEPYNAQDNDTMDEAVAATSITDGSVSTSQLSPNLPFDNVISPAVSPLAATPTAADDTDNESLSPSPGSATSDVASCSASLRGTTSSFVIPCPSNSTRSFDFSVIKIKQEPKDFEPDSSDSLSEEGESSTTTLCVASTSLLVECANLSVPNPEIIIISKTSSANVSTDSSNNQSSETTNLISTEHATSAQTVSSPKEKLTADLPSIEVIAPNTKSDSSLCHGTTCDGTKDTNSPEASTSTSDLRTFSIATLVKKIQQDPENDDEGVPGPSTGRKRKSPQRMFSGKRKTRTLNKEGGQEDSESDDNKESKKKMNEQKSKFKKRVKTKVKKKTKNEWVKNFKRNKCEKK